MLLYVVIREAGFSWVVCISCLCDLKHETVYFLITPFSTTTKLCLCICVLRVLCYACMEGNCRCLYTAFSLALGLCELVLTVASDLDSQIFLMLIFAMPGV